MTLKHRLGELSSIKFLDETLQDLDERLEDVEGGSKLIPGESVRIPEEATADASNQWELALGAIPEGAKKIKSVFLIPDDGFGQATDYLALQVEKVVSGSATALTGVSFNSTNVVDAFEKVNLLPIAVDAPERNLTAGTVLALKKTVTGEGDIFPGGIIQVVYE